MSVAGRGEAFQDLPRREIGVAATGGNGGHHLGDEVRAREQAVHDRLPESERAGARETQHVLHAVGQRGESGETHERRFGFQGMGEAEDLVDQFRIRPVGFQRHEGYAELLAQLLGFFEEGAFQTGLVEPAHRHGPASAPGRSLLVPRTRGRSRTM